MSKKPRSPLKPVGATLGAAAMLVVGIDYVSFAATGDSLLLGRGNTSSSLTSIVRTTNGGVLSLKARPGSPALNVNTKERIANLNADTVDNVHASALARRSNLTTFRGQCKSLSNITDEFAKIDDIGTFDKRFLGSMVEISFSTSVGYSGSDASGLIFELRAGQTPVDAVMLREGSITPVNFHGIVRSMDAGLKTVSLWVRTAPNGRTASSANYDPGCFNVRSSVLNQVQVVEMF